MGHGALPGLTRLHLVSPGFTWLHLATRRSNGINFPLLPGRFRRRNAMTFRDSDAGLERQSEQRTSERGKYYG